MNIYLLFVVIIFIVIISSYEAVAVAQLTSGFPLNIFIITSVHICKISLWIIDFPKIYYILIETSMIGGNPGSYKSSYFLILTIILIFIREIRLLSPNIGL